jgi:amino acid adenylation domain-containing protein
MEYLLSHIIEQSADRDPGKTALRFNGQSLSYAELVRRADSLAALLQDRGVKKLDRVGVFLNKSLETVVAIYGIMRAGGVYVPLDPLSPLTRLQFVFRDCGIRHLVTHKAKLDTVQGVISKDNSLTHIYGIPNEAVDGVDTLSWDEIYNQPGLKPRDPGSTELDLAYIMYTSGSTGSPKGLMHTHASGLSYTRLSMHTYDVLPEDVVSNHSPLHFDMSTFDYFTSLLAGATTVIIPEAYTKLPASLSQLIESEQISIWYSVPFALIQLLLRGALANRDLSALRWVLFGGEPFPPKHLNSLMALWPQARFSNVYGPAEVNQCTYYHVPHQMNQNEPVPIGKVWENAVGLVMDEDDKEVSPGEVGELLVRTPTMMRGYWNRPDLTERSIYRRRVFDNYEEIYFRTGDLVQTLPDDNLKFLGRKDRQVKIRGYRVELDEVENALSNKPKVEEAAVYAIPGEEGSQQIEAAVILKAGEKAKESDLKAGIAELLPSYAMPVRIRIQDAFPRTGSGKIDRRVLSELAQSALEDQKTT